MTRTKKLGFLSIVIGLMAVALPSTAAAGPFSPPAWFSEGVALVKQYNPAANCEPTLEAPAFADSWTFPNGTRADTGPTGCAAGGAIDVTPGTPTGFCGAANGHGFGPDSFYCFIGVSMQSSAVDCVRMTGSSGDYWQGGDPSKLDAENEHATLSDCLKSLDGVFVALSFPPKYSSGGPMKLAFSKPGKLVATDTWRSQCGKGGCSKKVKKKGYVHRMQPVKLTVTAAGVKDIQIKPSKAGRKMFKKSGKLQLWVELKFTPAGGGPVRTIQQLMVLRKPK